MINDERMVAFINSFDKGNTSFLNQIEKEARADAVPIIRTETQTLLRFLMAAHRPMEILEVGTAVGFSALLMQEYAPAGAHVTTIEKYEKRIPIARENFKRAGKEDTFLPEVTRLLKKGGLLVSDNVLQDGDVLESRFAVTRRNRTIHARMREYLYALTHHEQLETVILPVGDGVSISTKVI